MFQATDVLPEAARVAEEYRLGRHQDTFVGKKGLVPWSEISTAEAREGNVVSNRAGRFWAVHSRPVHTIPHVSLLLALTDICRRAA